MEEGETATLGDREFSLTTNRPVVFPLFTATDRTGESAGQVLTVEPGALTTLPAIRTVLRFGRKLEERALRVQLEARLSEIGTLEVWCRSRSTDHRWKLEFRLRDAAGPATPGHAADLVVCRSGATTVAELTTLGKPSILVPYPFAADDHQRANASVVAEHGAGLLILDRELTGDGLAQTIIALARDRTRLAAMAAAARRLGVPDAAARVVATCREVVWGGGEG